MPSPGSAPPGPSGTPGPPPEPARPPGERAAARTGLVLAALSAVLLWLVAASWSPLLSFDRSVANALHRRAVREPDLVHANRILTDWVWDPWTMRALIAVAVLWLWWRRERLLSLYIAAAVVLGTVIQQSLKAAVGRERPRWPDPVDSAHYAAFPSGHAMVAAVVCVLLLWLLRRHGVRGRAWTAAVTAAAVSVLGVGLTRLYLGVHWPSDVLGGWLMGTGWALLAVAAFPWVERRVRSRNGRPSSALDHGDGPAD
ncbi:phosphatase PAP2 family protein [Streptomyces qinzhouensis]|uniref:Phosphatase PAP2 family protein n=1 Tax=Streptomyces qinzhouensis TaxID=2599401 RepID=A0A5B8IEC3_9ACTN|nr:phosphatase PAP2 family protein [Streptomyces qinzhouensis]QDY75519.1 phosphatase PAP2 family protein [Streptomyces qinzhouensis]